MNRRYLLAPARGVLPLACIIVFTVLGCEVHVAPPPPPDGPCGEDDAVSCTRGVGWSCPPGDDPERTHPELQCSDAIVDGSRDDFCCYE